jgi:hypothetical protein
MTYSSTSTWNSITLRLVYSLITVVYFSIMKHDHPISVKKRDENPLKSLGSSNAESVGQSDEESYILVTLLFVCS